MALILAIVWVPRWLHAYGILFQRRPQYVVCTQYMATRTTILDVEIVLNQCLEEIAKKEAQLRHQKNQHAVSKSAANVNEITRNTIRYVCALYARAQRAGQGCVRHAMCVRYECLEKHVVFLVNVVNQWVIVVNQRILVV